jgi:hypothetical protein
VTKFSTPDLEALLGILEKYKPDAADAIACRELVFAAQ